MSQKALKIILLLAILMLVNLLHDSTVKKQRRIEPQKNRLENVQKFSEVLASKKDLPFLSANPALVTVRCFETVDAALKKQDIKVVQKQIREERTSGQAFFQTVGFEYELQSPDLPSVHKFLHYLQTQSPHLYQCDKIAIEKVQADQGKTSAEKSEFGYHVRLALTVYLLQSAR